MRTLTRSAAQVLGAITNTVWVELSTAFGAGDMPLARSLHRRACQASLWLALLLCALLLLVGRVVFERWTRGQVAFDVPLFLLLLAVTVCNSLWSASYVVPVAANRHQKVALTYVVATAASLLGAALLTRGLQVHGAALALLLIDIVMVAFVVPISLRMVGDETGGYARAVVTLPKDLPGRLLARRKQRA